MIQKQRPNQSLLLHSQYMQYNFSTDILMLPYILMTWGYDLKTQLNNL